MGPEFEYRQWLVDAAGGALSVAEAADRLSVTLGRIGELAATRELLAVPWHGAAAFPPAQFDDATGKTVSRFGDVLATMAGRNPWSILEFLVLPNAVLGERSPLQELSLGHSASVLRLLRQYESDGFA